MIGYLQGFDAALRAHASVTAGDHCNVFNELWLCGVHDVELDSRQRAMWRIHLSEDGAVPDAHVWGPVVAAEEIGITAGPPVVLEPDEPVPHLAPRHWYQCQGWSRGHVIGHTFVLYAITSRRVLVLDSNAERGPQISQPQDLESALRRHRWTLGVCAAMLKPPPRR